MTTSSTMTSMTSQRTTLSVDGMTCGNCVKHVHSALVELEGVRAVEVDLRGGKVVVEHDAAVPSTSSMIEALTDAGYDSRVGAD